MATENLVNGKTARKLLGEPGPPIGTSRFSALKRVTGQGGQRYVMVSVIRKYLLAHPDFTERDVYVRQSRPNTPSSHPGASGRKNDARLLTHA